MGQRPNDLRPWESPNALFGSELRRYREAAGLSIAALCEMIRDQAPYAKSTIGGIERGETRPDRILALQADRVLDTREALVHLWDGLFKDAVFPSWFDWHLVEPEADEIESYSLSVVDGLFQTPAYATALLRDADSVEARMKRQEIFTKKHPPVYSLLLDEGVLHRPAGNAEVMREQLEHLASINPKQASIQIVPASAEHDGNSGSFYLATMKDRAQIAYVESGARGFTMSESHDIATLSRTMKDLRSLALPVGMSRDLILRTVEERWST